MKKNNGNKKRYGVLILLLLVVGISIGYAALTTTLNINGTTTIGKASWDVHFENLAVTDGSVTATTAAAIDTAKTTINYEITLSEPGDFYEFTVDAVNGGTLDAELSADPEILGLTTEQDVYVNYTVTYEDGTALAAGDEIAASASSTYKVRVEYDTDITADQLPTEDQTISLTFAANYIQAQD